jgi:hypothetical protein
VLCSANSEVHSLDSCGLDLQVHILVIVVCGDTVVNSPRRWQEFRNCYYFNMSAHHVGVY